jgi:hypothetical protein
MSRLAIRLLAIGLLGLAAAQFHTTSAQACIKYDRAAELALIDEGIASPKTSEANKAVLRAIRKEIFFFHNKKSHDSEDVLQNHWLTTKALELLGRERIVWTFPEDTPVNQLTRNTKANVAGAAIQPSCG